MLGLMGKATTKEPSSCCVEGGVSVVCAKMVVEIKDVPFWAD